MVARKTGVSLRSAHSWHSSLVFNTGSVSVIVSVTSKRTALTLGGIDGGVWSGGSSMAPGLLIVISVSFPAVRP